MAQPPNQSDDQTAAHPDHFLKEWREFREWSQEHLAELLDLQGHSKVSRIESGKTALKAGFLRKIARVFGVPASAILDINPATADGRDAAEMLTVWGRIPRGKRADALNVLRALANSNTDDQAG